VPLLWLAICLAPGFLGNLHYRVVVSSLLLTALIAMIAVEFWRGREEPLMSRRSPALSRIASIVVVSSWSRSL
jgi:hypothetical protein